MNTPLEIAVARRLKAIRHELALGPAEMAKLLNVERTRYLNWEGARNLPNEISMIRLADHSGVTLDYIYRGKADAVPMGQALRIIAREKGLP